ncbi:Holliday junction resolvase RecU [Aeribacillus sp. FSL K6-8394]|uniref:Holliday junction resolvase RecU n=1 Tax=Aeribacillus sp. FSL K6-8394 TaxID=2954570 RepID=UPI0030F6D0A7
MAVSYANRGMSFEHLIERTNQQYFMKGIATIQKVATPWKVIRKGKQIVSAFPEKKSTVDFIGIYNGRAIAFDAKSTRERTRFPLSNIEEHQFNFLKQWKNNSGISFLLIDFTKKQEVYFLTLSELEKWWNEAEKGGRKSIPYEWFVENCNLVKSKNGILLDYLGVIEKCKTS